MSNEELKHIFENSACLTKKQMVSYVSGNMTNDEVHAVETHLNSCALCSDAIDSMLEQPEKASASLASINADFLQSHLENTGKQINLSSKPATSGQQVDFKKKKVQNLWRTVSLAAGLLLLVVSIWYYRMLQDDAGKKQIAQELAPPPQTDAKATMPLQPIAMNETVKESSVPPKQMSEPIAKTVLTRNAMANDAPAVADDEKKEKSAELEDVALKTRNANLNNDHIVIASKELEMPPTNYDVVRATAPSDYSATHPQTSLGNSYAADEKAVKSGASNYVVAKQSLSAIDPMEQADKLYEAKQYNNALNIYLRESNKESNDNERRDEARIGAARCYIAVGDKKRAQALLMAISAKHGKHKREAKRLLKEIR